MIFTIARFELAQRMKRLTTWTFVVLFLAISLFFVAAAGGAIPGAVVDFGAGSKVAVNSPLSILYTVTIISHFGLLIAAAIAGGATYQDVEHDTTAFFFTAPIRKIDYLGGRFLGALATLVVLYASIGAGEWIGMHLGIVDASRLGPDRFAAYAAPYALVLVPNLFFTTAIFFSLAALTRRMLAVYGAAVVLLLGYLVASNLAGQLENRTLAALVDPFALQTVDRVTQYWSVAERDARLVPFTGVLVANRAIWVGAGALLFAFTYVRFRFAAARGAADRSREETTAPAVAREAGAVALDFSAWNRAAMLLRLTRLETRETVKTVFFAVVVLAGVLFTIISANDVGELYGTKTYPVTYEVLEIAGGTFSLFVLIVLTFYSGELVFRERELKFSQIQDALPVPRWALFLSKLFTLMILMAILVAILFVSCLLVQIFHGYFDFELALYAKTLLGIRLVEFWILCALALAVQVVADNKLVGYGAMIVFLASSIALPLLGFEHRLYRYGSVVNYVYSAMNGFGPFTAPIVWFTAYWSCAAIFLSTVASALWVRGTDRALRARLKTRWSKPTIAIAVASFAGFVAIGAFIYWNTNIQNKYLTSDEREERQAQYEKKYAKWKDAPLPKIVASKVIVHLVPSKRGVDIKGTYTLENQTKEAIREIAISIPEAPFSCTSTLSSADDAKPFGVTFGTTDYDLGFLVEKLDRPLEPGERAQLEYRVDYEPRGFVNSDAVVRVAENGTFLDSDSAPKIGYDASRELEGDAARKRHGLAPKKWKSPDEPHARDHNYVARDADWIPLDITITTSADQIAVAPGRLVSSSTDEHGERTFRYVPDVPVLNFWSVLSARYAQKTDAWNDVALEIDYTPKHTYDLDRMFRGMKDGLAYFSERFGPYQNKVARIVEFPRYEQFAQSFPATIPYSESIGFIQKVDDAPDAIDFPYYVTAHEVAHQWWAHQVIGADAQGATVLSETLAQYSALMVMKHRYGEKWMRKFLRYELDRYLAGRARASRPEEPLARVEDETFVHYSKGSLVMFELSSLLGEDAVDLAIRRFRDAFVFKGPPYPVSEDLIKELRAAAGPDRQTLIDDLFERITIYEDRVVSATKTRRADGGYDVRVVAKAKKLHADELGHETEAPLDDFITVGALDKNGELLASQRVHVTGEDVDVTFAVREDPVKAGIDPLDELIDRMPEDNVMTVEEPK